MKTEFLFSISHTTMASLSQELITNLISLYLPFKEQDMIRNIAGIKNIVVLNEEQTDEYIMQGNPRNDDVFFTHPCRHWKDLDYKLLPYESRIVISNPIRFGKIVFPKPYEFNCILTDLDNMSDPKLYKEHMTRKFYDARCGGFDMCLDGMKDFRINMFHSCDTIHIYGHVAYVNVLCYYNKFKYRHGYDFLITDGCIAGNITVHGYIDTLVVDLDITRTLEISAQRIFARQILIIKGCRRNVCNSLPIGQHIRYGEN